MAPLVLGESATQESDGSEVARRQKPRGVVRTVPQSVVARLLVAFHAHYIGRIIGSGVTATVL